MDTRVSEMRLALANFECKPKRLDSISPLAPSCNGKVLEVRVGTLLLQAAA
jgi:hypothetical protein